MRIRRTVAGALLTSAAAWGLSGCAKVEQRNEDVGRVGIMTELTRDPDATASAPLSPMGGSRVEGTVTFAQYGSIVIVRAKVVGLPPHGDYGLHVHQARSCSAVAEAGSGGHFNPGDAPHGRHGTGAHHAGDLPNLRADGEGNAGNSFDSRMLSIGAGQASVIGRVVVVSSNADDYKTQPDGNSGKPLACGFIRLDGRPFAAPTR